MSNELLRRKLHIFKTVLNLMIKQNFIHFEYYFCNKFNKLPHFKKGFQVNKFRIEAAFQMLQDLKFHNSLSCHSPFYCKEFQFGTNNYSKLILPILCREKTKYDIFSNFTLQQPVLGFLNRNNSCHGYLFFYF